MSRLVDLLDGGLNRLVWPKRMTQSGGAQYGVKAQQPARRHGWSPLLSRGAGQRHLRRTEGLGKIMRGDTNRAFGSGDAEVAPHLPRHPRIVLGGSRPAAFVEPTEDEQVSLLQACLDQAPDREARVTAEGRTDDYPAGKRLEQCWIIVAGERREGARRVDQLVAEARGDLARLAGPEPLAAGLGRARRQPLSGLDMGYYEARERHGTRFEQLGQPAEAGIEAIDKATQFGVFIAQRRFETGEARSRTWPQDRLFKPTRTSAKHGRVEPTGGERMLQRGEQRHRSELAPGEIEHEAQKSAGRCTTQWHARRIVDLDPPAAQLDGNPAGELAVRSDECSGCSGCVELAAQQQRDRHRLLLRARTIEAADPVEGVGRLRRQAVPCVGGGSWSQRFADQPHPPSALFVITPVLFVGPARAGAQGHGLTCLTLR